MAGPNLWVSFSGHEALLIGEELFRLLHVSSKNSLPEIRYHKRFCKVSVDFRMSHYQTKTRVSKLLAYSLSWFEDGRARSPTTIPEETKSSWIVLSYRRESTMARLLIVGFPGEIANRVPVRFCRFRLD